MKHVAFALVLFSTPALANHHGHRPAHHHHHARHSHWHVQRPHSHPARRYAGHDRSSRETNRQASGRVDLPHPVGCPHTEFCGCGASVDIFGHAIRSLFLAANWFQFPAAAPAPGMVAVRRHHVMVIRRPLPGNKAIVYNANGGNHRTYIGVRSLAGYSIRNPKLGPAGNRREAPSNPA